MSRRPRAVVVGSGSAGRRHVRALVEARSDVAVTVVRRPGSRTVATGLPTQARVVASLADALADGPPDVAVVASPAPFHRRHALALLDAGTGAVLVEKPLAHDPADAAALVAADRGGLRVDVGYHLRRSDTPRALRDAAAGGAIGDVVALDLRVGQHLSAWRPGSDPADTVTARAELGGGVLSELSHELDALRWLAGPVTEVRARLRFDGAPTDGRVETVAELDLVAGGVPAAVHLDMVADPPLRVWELRGVDGVLRADLLAGTVERLRPGRAPEVLHRSEPGERDRAGQRMVDHLLQVAQGAAPGCPVAEAAPTVAVVAAARTSHDLGGAPAAVAPVEVGFA